MTKKLSIMLTVLAAIVLVFAGCEGPTGPAGAPGADGDEGTAATERMLLDVTEIGGAGLTVDSVEFIEAASGFVGTKIMLVDVGAALEFEGLDVKDIEPDNERSTDEGEVIGWGFYPLAAQSIVDGDISTGTKAKAYQLAADAPFFASELAPASVAADADAVTAIDWEGAMPNQGVMVLPVWNLVDEITVTGTETALDGETSSSTLTLGLSELTAVGLTWALYATDGTVLADPSATVDDNVTVPETGSFADGGEGVVIEISEADFGDLVADDNGDYVLYVAVTGSLTNANLITGLDTDAIADAEEALDDDNAIWTKFEFEIDGAEDT